MMADPSFVGYVGDSDFHDGVIVAVEHQNGMARVRVRGFSGKAFVVEFSGVRVVRANQPDGMALYALTEMRGEAPLRRFVFANWDDDSAAYLEVDAESIAVREA
jgi:hypothetical protein